MAQKLYVGDLSLDATEDGVRQLFAQYGSVVSVNLITDRDTGKPRGFGFVEMDDGAATEARTALDGAEFEGRTLRVNEARERRPGGGGRRGGGRSW